MRHFILLFCFLINISICLSQEKRSSITFILSDTINENVNNIKVNVLQNGKLQAAKFNDKITVLNGIIMQVEFLSETSTYKSIKSLKIYNDTILTINKSSLEEVVVKAKRYMVRQTLQGFEYLPQIDSLFREKSILLALQRLPFIRLEMDNLLYKQDGAIMFTINGKERQGISNWSDVLRNIKAKDIYKVEMITDLPTVFLNKGYNVIVNLLTADTHISGQSISASIIADQRQNFNKNIDLTLLKNKSDFSLSISQQEDDFKINNTTTAFRDNGLVSKNILDTKFDFTNYSATGKFGLRIDSAKDFSTSFSLKSNRNNLSFLNLFNNPSPISDQVNEIGEQKININVSYSNRKSKAVSQYVALSLNYEQQNLNRIISFLSKKTYDSINFNTHTAPLTYAIDLTHINNEKQNFKIEYGVQSYYRQTIQDYSEYSLNPLNNSNDILLKNINDSLNLSQYSITPYTKININISDKNNLVIRLNSQIYIIKNELSVSQNFFLPSLNISQKNLLKKNASLSLNTGINFYKPSLDFLTPIQPDNNPILEKTGNSRLSPSKVIYAGIEWNWANNIYVNQQLILSHGYDITKYFTTFDSTLNKLFQTPDDNNSVNELKYSIDLENTLFKKITLYTYLAITYQSYKNTFYRTSYKGFSFNATNSASISLGKKNGIIGFRTFLNGRNISAQGSAFGAINYSLYYAKSLFKNKISLTLIANEFFKKNRVTEIFSFSGNTEQYFSETRPFRLVALRFACNFSNIGLKKIAIERKAIIRGEVGNF